MTLSPLIPVHNGIQIEKRDVVGERPRIVGLTQNSMIWAPVCTGVSGLGVCRCR